MQFPQINNNGTAPSDLLEGYLTVKRYLGHALTALGEIAPHGRDYQTLPEPERTFAYGRAIDEHSSRVLKIRQLIAEFDTLAEHVVS
jgi:hypothetical protein